MEKACTEIKASHQMMDMIWLCHSPSFTIFVFRASGSIAIVIFPLRFPFAFYPTENSHRHGFPSTIRSTHFPRETIQVFEYLCQFLAG
jgi:hypothetical protein